MVPDKLWRANANPLFSKEAASYDSKHEKTLNKLIEEIRERVEFIGADWVDDDDEAGDDGEVQSENPQTKTVRLLDYACGTGVGMFVFPFAPLPCDHPLSFWLSSSSARWAWRRRKTQSLITSTVIPIHARKMSGR